MTSVLDAIIDGVREDLADRKARTSWGTVMASAAVASPARGVLDTFRSPGLSVIAEVKRRSPSKGDLAEIPEPDELAAAYQRGGAAAVSVLTEQRRFGGSLADLMVVRQSVDLPVLRKDFMVDPYQFYEARAAGADLVLLIVAALSDQQLSEFLQLSGDLGMTALVEVHDETETERAVASGAELIGVNARNLKTLEIHPDVFGRLAALIPDDRVKVAESGISGPDDAARYAAEGADVVLVGESLVKHGQPEDAVRAMTGWGA